MPPATLSTSSQLLLTCGFLLMRTGLTDPPEPRCGVQVSELVGPEEVCVSSQPPETLIFSDYGLSVAFLRATQSITATFHFL